jgi:hypothetical protein
LAVKKELCDILDDVIHYDDSVIRDFFLTRKASTPYFPQI